MKFMLLEISQNPEKYEQILQHYVLVLVPMVNPDGVVLGNSRCSLAGLDLNRRWAEPSSVLHPEIYFLKNNLKAVEK